MKKIMFVCSGNTCRSAMAEQLFLKKIKERNLQEKFSVSSAGIIGFSNAASPDEVKKVMMDEYGIDITAHRARRVNREDVNEMDLILTMTKGQVIGLLGVNPDSKGKTYPLKEYVGLTGNIDDPFGESLEVYSACAKELNHCIDLLLDKEVKE